MIDELRSLQKTINFLVETMRNIIASGGRAGCGSPQRYAECSTRSHHTTKTWESIRSRICKFYQNLDDWWISYSKNRQRHHQNDDELEWFRLDANIMLGPENQKNIAVLTRPCSDMELALHNLINMASHIDLLPHCGDSTFHPICYLVVSRRFHL